ncbi:MAG: sugar ABC transporter ATP-binding protein, partial [Pirellulaceae bacterium]|nr:sugar ABC transporter ATP-binding protein [Pirellulaceae bacterium]
MSAPLLKVTNICKRFPGVRALHNVSLELAAGEVLALIGENGAGKSTLMKILAGVQPPDSGQLVIDGDHAHIDSVHTALALGVSLIHQELNMADNLDVGANVFLGREPRRLGLIDRDRIRRESRVHLDAIGLDVSPDTIVSTLPIGKQQMVEIVKAMSVNARILIMDEPTSSLSTKETESLFRVVRDLRERGVSIIYISHRLGEVKQLADRVVVLRDGENAGELSREETNHDAMVKLMVGRDVSQFYARQPHTPGDIVFDVSDVVTPAWPHNSVSLQLRAGEIVGLAGLVGAGRTELLRCLFGVDRALSGAITIAGESLPAGDVIKAISSGFALVPEDRKLHGLVLDMSVRHNVGLAGLRSNSRAGWLNAHAETRDAVNMIDRLRIKTPSPDQIARYLSGGNQQKVVLGKWLSLSPKVLLLDEPTRGIDVGAKQEIYRLMEELAAEGVAILFASSEMEEILGMSDRVLVMHEGRLAGAIPRHE